MSLETTVRYILQNAITPGCVGVKGANIDILLAIELVSELVLESVVLVDVLLAVEEDIEEPPPSNDMENVTVVI